jgi:hypothetical protein
MTSDGHWRIFPFSNLKKKNCGCVSQRTDVSGCVLTQTGARALTHDQGIASFRFTTCYPVFWADAALLTIFVLIFEPTFSVLIVVDNAKGL